MSELAGLCVCMCVCRVCLVLLLGSHLISLLFPPAIFLKFILKCNNRWSWRHEPEAQHIWLEIESLSFFSCLAFRKSLPSLNPAFTYCELYGS